MCLYELVLNSFEFQSVIGNVVSFRVHAPCSGAFLLDIFANAVTPKEYLTGEPMKFKSVCKFKVLFIEILKYEIMESYCILSIFQICCSELQTVMVPLPDCASGEWGPTKATRLFGLVPITHQVFFPIKYNLLCIYGKITKLFLQDALVFAGREVEIQFRMSRQLTDFMATLHKNGVEEKRLSKFVTHTLTDDIVTFVINFPEEGMYYRLNN